MTPYPEPSSFNEDTNPIRPTISPDAPSGRNVWGLLALVGASVFTFGAILLFALPSTPPPVPTVSPPPSATTATITSATQAQIVVSATPNTDSVQLQPLQALPTIDSSLRESLLATPLAQLVQDSRAWRYNPFTFIPERARSEFIEYTVKSGDTIDQIGIQYGIQPESIAWCNDRRIIFAIRPGDVLRIPPTDGACHVVLGTRQETITKIAEQYKVTAQDLINSPYTPLYDRSPDDVLPGGTSLFIPNGQGELINWNPGSEVETDENGTIRSISFASGQSGSCGAVDPGGGAAWGNPLPNGTWVRGFSVGHTGIDLSAPIGTPIYAANSGPVLFSGFSTWGYGETIVLAHGAFSTLYAHMFARSIVCGQYANVGQVIGTVGSTGNSTGPHLHFEIRFSDQPQNPSGMPGVGW